ncbi:RraA family protein [Sporosarcina cascadiensis]|uniref:RraA family protein n=1 Tax=Sporosarcina cascadiensis TaxID=2660747 RepID=UPI00129AB6D6|nr:RraA family protein [Sporosarcina cascadiensis]
MTKNNYELSKSDLLKLRKFNTPAVYNGWEQITDHDVAIGSTNITDVKDHMPELGPMVGYAVTVVIEPSNESHKANKAKAVNEYRRYMASMPGPKIVVTQDKDHNPVGSFWGEVNANIHKSLGCVGTIVDGAVRDIDEMGEFGFKALSKRLCVGHAHVTPIDWNCEVEVFGCKVKPGQLIHADKHGFLVIPKEDEPRLLESTQFMDNNELDTVIPSGWNTWGLTQEDIVNQLEAGAKKFGENVRQKFKREGEW